MPKKQAIPWLAADCVLCGASGAGEVCGACDEALERVGHACHRCALPLESGELCGACLDEPPAFDGALAVFAYRFPLDRLVQRFKYGGDLAVGAWLARGLAQRVACEARPDLLVVPPSARDRLRERGFNQALEIAKGVAAARRLRCSLGAVQRVREGMPQARLARGERLANLREAFRCEADVRGLDVAIVDDVMTTGATAEAIAAVLKRAGAARVRVWAVARTPEPRSRV